MTTSTAGHLYADLSRYYDGFCAGVDYAGQADFLRRAHGCFGESGGRDYLDLGCGTGVLLADLWPAINRFPQKPLIYNIAWKTVIYFAVASFIHYLERLYDFGKEAGGFVAGNEKLLATIVWPHFWAIQIILLVMIFNYCVIRELGRVLGEDRMIRLFFRQPPGELLRGLEGPPGVNPASRRP